MRKIDQLARLSAQKVLSLDDAVMQAMQLLINLRHDLTHYEMKNRWPQYMDDFQQRGIALNALEKDNAYEPWPIALSCSEGIRWANNTACSMVRTMYELMPEPIKSITHAVDNFVSIEDTLARVTLTLKGIDPDSTSIL